MISGINHITFSVRDLGVSFHFYANILGLRPVARWYNGAYLEAGNDWVCLAAEVATRASSLPEYTHTAFTVSQEDFSPSVERIRSAGAVCWQENRSHGDSYYFLDPDGHKLEIHVSTLSARIRALTTIHLHISFSFAHPEKIERAGTCNSVNDGASKSWFTHNAAHFALHSPRCSVFLSLALTATDLRPRSDHRS